MRQQLASMTIIELVRTANNYATSIKQAGVDSDLIKELSSRLEALNLAYIAQVRTHSVSTVEAELPPASPAIASLRAEARAEGINFAASRLAAAYNHGFIDKPLAEVGDVVRMILTAKEDLANNPAADGLSGEYAEKALADWTSQLSQSARSPVILALPVERDQYGYWTHPAYDAFCDGREHVPTDEFNAWMNANGLEWTVDYRDEEDIDPAVDGYDISKWLPKAPAGEGWFVGSIHDSEDGAVCIWLRNKSEASRDRQSVQVKGVQS